MSARGIFAFSSHERELFPEMEKLGFENGGYSIHSNLVLAIFTDTFE